jgi:hypothetical protein
MGDGTLIFKFFRVCASSKPQFTTISWADSFLLLGIASMTLNGLRRLSSNALPLNILKIFSFATDKNL